MGNKLVKGGAFNQDVPHTLTVLTPFAPDDLLCSLTILVQKETRMVELSAIPGTILHQESVALELLELARQRIKELRLGRLVGEVRLPS